MEDSLNLSQFYQVFYDEAAEHLAEMEALLLNVDVNRPDTEELNAIFRAAHSIKGGAATFGFTDLTELTHEMETVFDRVRKHEMPLTTALVDAFLASGDMLKALLAVRRSGGEPVPATDIEALCGRLRAFLEVPAGDQQDTTGYILTFGPFDDSFTSAQVETIVADLHDFGKTEALDDGTGTERRFRIATEVPESDLNDVLAFVAPEGKYRIIKAQAEPVVSDTTEFGLFMEAPGINFAPPPQSEGAEVREIRSGAPRHSAADSTSIRVSIEKVDQLINLVGELVITQAMLAQAASEADSVRSEKLQIGLAQLERNTRDLQEAAMSIRMMPMSFVFSRFPRMVRDLAAKLGKEVEFTTIGETTELDKGLIERIVDPLTHLVRNSLDHGIEMPDTRAAAGKSPRGNIMVSAFHQGGHIVIEVADDGRGLDRTKLIAKARERGMDVDENMSDVDAWNLIFEPGFSTAAEITDVSGRGVGMDVVRRNIKDMGGRVEIDSTVGSGTRITIRLPLTLAILDGMSVRVGEEIYILPLGSVTESLRLEPGSLRTLNGSEEVILVRGDYVPVVRLHHVLGIASPRDGNGILVIVEADGGRSALYVDDLVGQHQVVIKSLEANFRKVEGISGATIMGDGRVAMILDVAHLVGLTHSRMPVAA